tara:strand:+ start:823 stop:2364 length:1542 start_codon:yes stop_codon:yes gene_type:complete
VNEVATHQQAQEETSDQSQVQEGQVQESTNAQASSQSAGQGGETTQASLANMQDGAGNQAALDAMAEAQSGGEVAAQSGGVAAGTPADSGGEGEESASRGLWTSTVNMFDSAVENTVGVSGPGTGSANVISASGENESAFDDVFTPALAKLIASTPDRPMTEILEEMAEKQLLSKNSDQPTFHPDLVSVGQPPLASEGTETKKSASLIGNSDYPGTASDLPGAKTDLTALAGALSGYDIDTHENQDAGDMESVYRSRLKESTEGDEVFLSFSGHGSDGGLQGVDNKLFVNAKVQSMVNRATAMGIHLNFVIDACHSANATSLVREEYASKLFEENNLDGTDFKEHYREIEAQYSWYSDLLSKCIGGKEVQIYERDRNDYRAADKSYEIAKAAYEEEKKKQSATNAFGIGVGGASLTDKAKKLEEFKEAKKEKLKTMVKSRQEAEKAWLIPTKRMVDEKWAQAVETYKTYATIYGVAMPPGTIKNPRTMGRELDFFQELMDAILEQVSAKGSAS